MMIPFNQHLEPVGPLATRSGRCSRARATGIDLPKAWGMPNRFRRCRINAGRHRHRSMGGTCDDSLAGPDARGETLGRGGSVRGFLGVFGRGELTSRERWRRRRGGRVFRGIRRLRDRKDRRGEVGRFIKTGKGASEVEDRMSKRATNSGFHRIDRIWMRMACYKSSA